MDKKILKGITKAILVLSTVSLVGCGGDDDNSSSGSVPVEDAGAVSCLINLNWASGPTPLINVTNSCNYAVNAYFVGTSAVKVGILGRKTIQVNMGGGDAYYYGACRQPYHPQTNNDGKTFYCSPNP